jgi:uncharacterized protein YbcI
MATSEPRKQETTVLDDEDSERPTGGQLREITRAMISIYKEQFGRGPRNAHSHYAGPNIIICVLEGTHTPVENTLVRIGEEQRLQDIRQLFQSTTEQTFRSIVEEITGRKTIGFMSGNDVTNDMASEIFVFEPAR